PAGEMFVLLAQRWRADEARIQSDVKRMQGVDFGHIRLAAMDSQVNGVIPRFLDVIAERYPRVRVDVEIATPDGAAELLDEGQCDLILAFNLRRLRDVHIIWSAELPLYCVVAPTHAFAGQRTVKLSEVRKQAIVVQSRALSIRRMLDEQHAWVFEDGPPPVVTNSLQLLKQLVVGGRYVALTSEMDAAPELIGGSLSALKVKARGISAQSISVAVSARRTLPRIANEVANCLAEEASAMLDEVRTAQGSQREF
ncbi:MAG: LysR substrate-binding domain-containing protein, partial [Pseudomonadota bacterium]